MKKIYTHENRFLVYNAKNLVEAEGIKVVLKNEYTGGGLGEIAVFDTWPELWVVRDEDYEAACTVIATALSASEAPEWRCPQCGESNDAAFEFCWRCNTPALPDTL